MHIESVCQAGAVEPGFLSYSGLDNTNATSAIDHDAWPDLTLDLLGEGMNAIKLTKDQIQM